MISLKMRRDRLSCPTLAGWWSINLPLYRIQSRKMPSPSYWKIGIRALINLTEEPLPEELLKKVGILTEQIPVIDFTAPTLKQVEQAVTIIHFYLYRNMPVAVHCMAGLGRTGTILACYLVREGKSADEAIAAIRRWRYGSIETLDQEAVIHEYEQFCRSWR
jgi:atypical dual specificity phosphatase